MKLNARQEKLMQNSQVSEAEDIEKGFILLTQYMQTELVQLGVERRYHPRCEAPPYSQDE